LSDSPPSPAVADAVVVAAGSSRRMDGVDKLAWRLGGRPLLAWTLDAVTAPDEVEVVVLVTSAERHASLVDADWLPRKVRAVAIGGDRRQDSVIAGITALERLVKDGPGDRVVLIHDGARPVLRPSLVSAVVRAAHAHGAAIPVVPVVETVKRVADDRVVETVDRTALWTAQTPQGVRRSILRAALADPVAVEGTWTDEAALLEACRIPVHVVPGDPANLKVTMPSDLSRAATLLATDPTAMRYGIGQDAHPFGPGSPLMLGGIAFDRAPRLAGHSDGDVALHAVADALLGAAGLGDLGRLFPAGAGTPSGVASGVLLTDVVARLAEAGWRPATIDLTVIGARPRLGDRLDAMRTAIAALLRIDPSRVSVKASTGNLDGPEGAGRSMSALALASIEALP
jgi:2-C-methyl-D-erythritol 4-phosphate cytidylyltransferase / 2-C-methyl-D-erythritol 2,4-cyclodiphosphate synthase